MNKRKEYVCGFMLSDDYLNVVLIEKNRPAYMKGRLNGVGGKIEAGETPVKAMVREFEEETGMETNDYNWIKFCELFTEHSHITFFYTIQPLFVLRRARTVEDELISVYYVDDLKKYDHMPNLQWLIPMAVLKDKAYRYNPDLGDKFLEVYDNYKFETNSSF